MLEKRSAVVKVNKFVCVVTMKTLGLWANGGVAPSTLTLALYHSTEMGGLLHAPASLPQGESLLALINYETT